MRDINIFLHMSLDGIVEGPKGAMDIGFVAYNQELEAFAEKTLSSVDTILWGRATYDMMYAYWPNRLTDPAATDYERRHAKWITDVEKVVASSTLESVDWNNSTLIKNNLTKSIEELKIRDGQDILVLGSPRLARFLLAEKIVDKVTLTLSPTLVGNGLRLFENISSDLKLISSETFTSGALGLEYKVIN
ncbi:dihydrofolate reductase family protein [Streptococcus pseudoporcinus]|uniref:Riboflavin biosynthesis protein RibD C-terminal domain protein n=1 Tax=Streptococcus pseudoporcinus LQ 940-04 TaxID=875093 RepID=G5KAY9_9STRE|nr:dihydrofolate reductase family protein [Streptococcus pseudoporcinus]EFR43786.1 riboflavin biosynthesis protein RibD C-terminal domain protein [Streptococcus pseudoporcinus SPIN 20026]EHI65232.1 riboflavin biosynthesis protein RibD C-terminal domain protein [Streptococcus pseudoporcinus LQ 940-04]VEF93216.1 riboflavin biosynthesis protein RibD C-terminal domain protein [Streptococcus pseudoporcinus]